MNHNKLLVFSLLALVPSLACAQASKLTDCRTIEAAGNFVASDETLVDGMVCKVPKIAPPPSSGSPATSRDAKSAGRLALMGIIEPVLPSTGAKPKASSAEAEPAPEPTPAPEIKPAPARAPLHAPVPLVAPKKSAEIAEVAPAESPANVNPPAAASIAAPVAAPPLAETSVKAKPAPAAPQVPVQPSPAPGATIAAIQPTPAASSVVAPQPVAKPAEEASVAPPPVAATRLTASQPSGTLVAPVAGASSASAVAEPPASPAPAELSVSSSAKLDPEPAADPSAAQSQPPISTGGFATAGTSDSPANNPAESAPAEGPVNAIELAEPAPQPRPSVEVGGFEKPTTQLAAFDPDRHRVSFGEDDGQAFQEGQHPGCTKNVSLGSVGKEKLFLGIPEWAARWIEKNNKKLPGICFSDSPMSGAQNFLIVFYTSASSAPTELPASSASTSAAAWPQSQGAFTTSYGSTWHYNHDETVGTTVTSLLPNDSPHSRPSHISYAMVYTEDGLPISQRWPASDPKNSKDLKESTVKPASAKSSKKHDNSAGVDHELDDLLSLVVIDIEKQ